MPIEINNVVNSASQRAKSASEQADGTKARNTGETDAKAEAEEVRISADAHSLTEIQARINRAEPFDAARVEAIRDSLSKGDYPIDEGKLAERFYALESMLSQ